MRVLHKFSTWLLVLLLVVAVVAVCKPEPTVPVVATRRPRYDVEIYGDLESVDPRDQVVVLWHSFTQSQEELLLTLKDEFNAANEWGIAVIGEYAGSPDALYDGILSRVESGALPQFVVSERHQIGTYAMRDALVALDPYMESEAWGYTQDELDDFSPLAMAAGQLPRSGGRYGWPLYLTTEVLYYNEGWLVELGYTEPPATWEEFGEMACAASEPTAGTYGYEFSVDAFTFADMLSNRDGQMFDEDAKTYAFGGVGGLETLTFTQELLGGGCAVQRTERFGDRADFGDGAVLFTIGSTAELLYYRDAVARGAGFNWSISPLPNDQRVPRMLVHSPLFSVFRTTPEKQLAAWLFLKWFTEPEQQARWAQAFSAFPVRLSAKDAMEGYLAENPRYGKALGFLKLEAAIEPGVAGYGECREAIKEMLTAVAGRGDSGPWLANTVETCNASLVEIAGR